MNDNDTRPNPVTDHLDLWSSITVTKATSGRGSNGKVSPYGIQKLRELILELAVRGKLVGQDTRDFQIEVVAGCDGEVPFDIPESWNWASVGNFAETRLGKMLDKVKNKGKPFRYLRNINVRWFDFDLSDVKEMRFEDTEREEFSLRRGDVLICEGGYPGRAAVWDERETDIYFQKALHRVRLPEAVNPHYFVLVLRESANSERINSYFTGAGIQHFTGKGLKSFLVPLPSSAEQHRIVAKVDELMALCDQLEQQQTDSLQAHQTLVETLLRTLVETGRDGRDGMDAAASAVSGTVTDNAQASRQAGIPRATAESPQQAWNRIAEHFDTLFTTEASIDQLKQTILQLAVMGKLVPQDPNDEPASVLLEKIAEEKKRLILSGEIRKQKSLPSVTASEAIVELPIGWNWTRFDELALHSDSGWSPKCEAVTREGSEWGVLKVSAVTWDKYAPGENKALPQDLQPRPEHEVMPGDFLISRANTADLVAKAVVVPDEAPAKLMMSDKIIRFVFSSHVNHQFLSLVNASEFARRYYSQVAGGTSSSMKNVSRAQIRNMVVGLPPLTEQHRIVAKVNELMTLCDTLKTHIQETQTTQVHLADAVVEQAVA